MRQRFVLLTCFLFTACFIQAQSITDLEENTPYKYNGLEYGFYITNQQSREVKGEDYERYEVVLYVSNNSGCFKHIPYTTRIMSTSDETLLADFTVKNATGKRLTSKSGKIYARPWYTQVRLDSGTKVNAQVGYAARNGETITNRIIVIVPKGERPKINCRTVYLPD